ncbi:MAG: hypothetical protein HFJ35_01090 [Clostridia bacterium]|nr:hypothetical protein [Clostridia bacterium]
MYHESYEDYIRSILGYPNYGSNDRENSYQNMATAYRNNQANAELESCYPEIYKVVYPMVSKACSNNTKPVTAELIEELTNEIYLSVENDNEINVTINLTNQVGNREENRSNISHTTRSKSNMPSNNYTKTEKTIENRGEDRQFRNRGLQDLIRILLIRELLGRPGNRPPMPPQRPPIRPPFPGRPGNQPPIMPRNNDYYNPDLYE